MNQVDQLAYRRCRKRTWNDVGLLYLPNIREVSEKMEILNIKTRKVTWLHRIDGRVKVISCIMFLFTIVALRDPLIPAAVAIFNFIILLRLGVPIKKLVYPSYVAFVIFLILMFTVPGKPVFRIGFFTATEKGLRLSTLIMLKVLACTSLLLITIATTPIHDFSAALSWLRIPSVVVELVVLMIRYIDVLADEFQTLILAMKSKNAFSKSLNWRKKVYNMGTAAGIILLRSLDRAERIYMAMTSRGYDPSKQIVKYRNFGKFEYIGLTFSIFLCAMMILLDVRLGCWIW